MNPWILYPTHGLPPAKVIKIPHTGGHAHTFWPHFAPKRTTELRSRHCHRRGATQTGLPAWPPLTSMPATTFVNINCKKKPLRKTAKQKQPHALRHVSGRQTPRLNAKPTALQRKTDRPATPNGAYRNAKRRLSHTANSPEKAVSSGIPPPVCPALHAKTAASPPQRAHSQPLTPARPTRLHLRAKPRAGLRMPFLRALL